MRMTIAALAILLGSFEASAQDRPDKTDAERSREAIDSKLNTMVIDLNFEDASLADVVRYFREYTGLNWLIDPEVGEGDGKVTLRLKGVKVVTAMRLILRDMNLAAVVKDGMVVIVTKEALQNFVVTRIYDVRDLFIKINNFAGPRLELLPGQGAGGGPGVSFTLEEPVEAKIDQGMLEDILRSTTGGDSWDENANAAITMAPNGLMIIAQTKKVHAEIERLIGMLRWFQ
ncbi:MAG TPA: hypothetical protein VI643_08170 [Planctomycetota bacterium]|nr:hypothetical protein [Planctomycetota bacterium]